MSDRDPGQDASDYRNLLRSPYDPDPGDEGRKEGESDLPWVPAVVSATLGALVVGVFVVFAVVTGPDAPEEVTTSTTLAASVAPEQDTGPPPSFVAVTEDVAATVTGFSDAERGSVAAVATAVDAGVDPATVPALDVAYWALVQPEGEQPMRSQYSEKGAIGNITVEFPPGPVAAERALVPYVSVGEAVTETFTIELDPTVPQAIEGQRLELTTGDVVVIDRLTIGDGWGWSEWSTERSAVAKVDVVVTFVDTDDPGTDDVVDPTQLLSPHLVPLRQGTGVPPLAPLYGFTGSDGLARFAEPLSTSNAPTAITVEFRVTVPADIERGTEIPLPPAG
jgi:hypothetical protein